MLHGVRNFFKEEDGLGTVELVVIVAVLVGLALLFKNQLLSLVNQIFDRIFSDAGSATNSNNQPTTTRPLGN